VVCGVKFTDEGVSNPWRILRDKGLQSLIRFANIHGDNGLYDYLSSTTNQVAVHSSCHSQYTNKRHLQHSHPSADQEPSKKLRSTTPDFDWKQHCFLCGEQLHIDPRHPERSDGRQAQTLEIHQSVMTKCLERNDQWALEVRGRLETCNDLPAVEAVYHKGCHRDFFQGRVRCQDTTTTDEVRSILNTKRTSMKDAFDRTCDWLENSADELYTVPELHAKMVEFAGGVEGSYSLRHFQSLLQERYGETLVISDVRGRQNVVCFRNLAKRIIHDKWYDEREKTVESESQRIVIAAARLIKASILEASYSVDEYPPNSTLKDPELLKECVPELVKIFMEKLVNDELKQVAIGHSLMQAVRPRSVIAPVLFALGVSLDHCFGSELLLKLLSRLGFCVSYDEVCRYKQSVLQQDHGQEELDSFPDAFTQWAADNVDHNVATLDGLGTFHGMGVIAMSVQHSSGSLRSGSFGEKPVVRCKRVQVNQLIKHRGIKLHHYCAPEVSPFKQLCLKPRTDLKSLSTISPCVNLDLLWHVGWFFRDASNPRPCWSGFMQDVIQGIHPPSADFRLLPIIDLNPNDRSCIYSTLVFVEEQAKRLNMPVACLTFDQPLWIKAVEIVAADRLNVVCRLGGFHMLMSFLGSIGSLMAGSGLAEALECIYGPNTTKQILTGKSYARAVRGHVLVESSLYVLLLRLLLDPDDSSSSAESAVLKHSDIAVLRASYDKLVETGISIRNTECDSDAEDSILSNQTVTKLSELVATKMDSLSAASRTAKLWMLYLRCVKTLKLFIRAERTGDFKLHVHSVSEMLNLFAATGHANYAKSGRLYLQLLCDLEERHEWLYSMFNDNGYHTVRRSDRTWAGLSTDLVIEQVMMKSLKSRGGLTHGRGMTESVRLQWVHSMHKCADVYAAVVTLTGLADSDNTGHVELGKSRSSRDSQDLLKLIAWFAGNSPYHLTDERLCSLGTGLVASETDKIDCDAADEVGGRIMTKMDNVPVSDVSIRKSDQVRTLAVLEKNVNVGKTKLVIDSSTLFCRLLMLLERSEDRSLDLESYFKYELTATPTSLFTSTGMRKTTKSALMKEILKTETSMSSATNDDTEEVSKVQQDYAKRFVIDGGCLLHKVKWMQNGTYCDILQQYVRFVHTHYGSDVAVVFDGYCNGPSTKDHEHMRRSTKCAADVILDEEKPSHRDQSAFLANENNKEAFVLLLIDHLQAAGITVNQALNDADTLIAETALEIAASVGPVTVVADDTDVLILLIHHFRPSMSDIFMLSVLSSRRSGRTLVMSIRQLTSKLGDSIVRRLLTIHAVSGCDTTCALFGYGKARVLKKIGNSEYALSLVDRMEDSTENESVSQAGVKLLVFLYGGKEDESLNHLRFVSHMNQLASTRLRPCPERLPPTERAAHFHILRVYLQVMQWKLLMRDGLNPVEWGWKLVDGKYSPVETDLDPAPDNLLNILRCKCKSDTPHACSSRICSCVKHGLRCVPACKHCYGELCQNVQPVVVEYTEKSDEEELEVDDSATAVAEDSLQFDSPWWNLEEEVVDEATK